MTTESIPITAIVLTYNEAINIVACLSAMTGIDDIVLVDSGSTDDTVTLARRARPDVRVYSNPFVDFGAQRNWALDNCAPRHEWIVFIDADEYCTPEFLQELKLFVLKPDSSVGAYVAGMNYFLGRWLKRTMMYPSYQLRVLKMGHVRYRKEGHGQREVTDGACVYFKAGWLHYGFSKGIKQWIARHNQYSSDEAELILRQRTERVDWAGILAKDPIRRRRAIKHVAARAPLRPLLRFVYMYLLRGGFLDGRAGLWYCSLWFAQDIHISVKIAELRDRRRTEPVGAGASDTPGAPPLNVAGSVVVLPPTDAMSVSSKS